MMSVRQAYSKGMNADGLLADPETRWGGIMRRIETSDFDATNIQYIEFWMMDPFVYDSTNAGQLYFNLGIFPKISCGTAGKALKTGCRHPKWSRMWIPPSGDGFPPCRRWWMPSIITRLPRPSRMWGMTDFATQDELIIFRYRPMFSKVAQLSEQVLLLIRMHLPTLPPMIIIISGDRIMTMIRYYSSVLERYKKFNGTEGNSVTSANSPGNVSDHGHHPPEH